MKLDIIEFLFNNRVKIVNTLMTIYCIPVFIGCVNSDMEDNAICDLNRNYSEVGDNEYAKMLLEHLSHDESSSIAFKEQINTYDPLYDHVGLKMTSKHGLCFTIPYRNDNEKVIGAVFFPVEYSQLDDNHIKMGDGLMLPFSVDGEKMHKDIDFGQRFLFSNYFKELEDGGISVDTVLISYMYLLNNPVKCDDNYIDKSQHKNLAILRRANSCLIIDLFLEIMHSYSGPYDGCVWGLSNSSIERFARSAADITMGVRLMSVNYTGGELRTTLMIEDYTTFLEGIIADYTRNICITAATENWNLSVQYSYYTIQNTSGVGDDEETGAIVSGGASSGNTGIDEIQEEATDECGLIENSEGIKADTKNALDSLFCAKKYIYGTTSLNSFEDFLDSLSKNPLKEIAASLDFLNEKYGLRNLTVGKNTSAEISPSKNTSIINIHTHPSGTLLSPSPKDLLNFANYGHDKSYEKYQGEMVLSCTKNDTTVYYMKVGNRDSLNSLYEKINDEIDINNDFKEDGVCAKYLRDNSKAYKKLSKDEQLIMKLILIADQYTGGEGMKICKYQWDKDGRKKGKSTAYGKKDVTNKGNITSYRLIKCE